MRTGVGPVTAAGPARGDSSQYEILRQMFLEGQFAAGEQLIPGRLSKLLGVSRTPVREALALLERDGVVRQSTRGYLVIDPSPQELMELLEARAGVDSYTASLAAEKRSPLDVTRINEIHQRTVSATDLHGHKRLHELFHQALRQAAHNPQLETWLGNLDFRLAVCDTHPETGSGDNMAQIGKEHSAIVEAITAGDAEAARVAMLEHHRRYQDLRMRLLAQDGLPASTDELAASLAR